MKIGKESLFNALGFSKEESQKEYKISGDDISDLRMMIDTQRAEFLHLQEEHNRLKKVIQKMKVVGVTEAELMSFPEIAMYLRLDKDILINFSETKPLEALHLIMRTRETRMQTLIDNLASFQVSPTGKELWERNARVRGKYENKMHELPKDIQQLLTDTVKIEKHAEILTDLANACVATADGVTRIVDAADLKLGLAKQLEGAELEYDEADLADPNAVQEQAEQAEQAGQPQEQNQQQPSQPSQQPRPAPSQSAPSYSQQMPPHPKKKPMNPFAQS